MGSTITSPIDGPDRAAHVGPGGSPAHRGRPFLPPAARLCRCLSDEQNAKTFMPRSTGGMRAPPASRRRTSTRPAPSARRSSKIGGRAARSSSSAICGGGVVEVRRCTTSSPWERDAPGRRSRSRDVPSGRPPPGTSLTARHPGVGRTGACSTAVPRPVPITEQLIDLGGFSLLTPLWQAGSSAGHLAIVCALSSTRLAIRLTCGALDCSRIRRARGAACHESHAADDQD
jgi:hypothetical protein